MAQFVLACQIGRVQNQDFDGVATLGEPAFIYPAKILSRPGLELQDGELRKYFTELRNLEAHGDISPETSSAWRAGWPFRWALSLIGHAYRAWNAVEPVQVSEPSICNRFGIPSSYEHSCWQKGLCGTPSPDRSSGLAMFTVCESHLHNRAPLRGWMAGIPVQYWGTVSAP